MTIIDLLLISSNKIAKLIKADLKVKISLTILTKKLQDSLVSSNVIAVQIEFSPRSPTLSLCKDSTSLSKQRKEMLT